MASSSTTANRRMVWDQWPVRQRVIFSAGAWAYVRQASRDQSSTGLSRLHMARQPLLNQRVAYFQTHVEVHARWWNMAQWNTCIFYYEPQWLRGSTVKVSCVTRRFYLTHPPPHPPYAHLYPPLPCRLPGWRPVCSGSTRRPVPSLAQSSLSVGQELTFIPAALAAASPPLFPFFIYCHE